MTLTAYWQNERVLLYHGDCREILPELGPKSIDCVIADPPYGVTSLAWDRGVDRWLDLVPLLLKDSGSVWLFGSLRSFLRTAPGLSAWALAQEVVWEKHNGTNLAADRFRRVHELIVQLYPAAAEWATIWKAPVYTQDATARTIRRKRRPAQWIGATGATLYTSEDGGPRLMRSVIRCRSEHGRAEHPTQKPVDIIRPLIEYSCPSEGVVLDPMAGSGTTGVAAQMLSRRAVLVEAEERYCELAARRCAEAVCATG